MNIAMIGPFGLRPKGTMAVRALPLARALAERGHHPVLVLPPWNDPDQSGKRLSDGGVDIINITLPPRLPLLSHLTIAWRLARAAFAVHPAVIHCFKPKAYAGLAALLIWLGRLLRLTSVRLVVDSDDWEGPGGWNEIEHYSRAQKAFFAWQERWGLTHCDALTVASRALQSIAWSMGGPPQRVVYLPNGSMWSATTLSSHPGEPATTESSRSRVLLYTRFFEFSLARVVAIAAGVLASAPQADLVVVGAGLFGEEREFMARMAAEGLEQRVTYAGWRDPAELPAYFAAVGVAIYPFDDTLINRAKCAVKLIDLLAAGVPVVADRVGQNAEYIEHGVSGLLVEPGDTAGFVRSVCALLEDRVRAQTMGNAAAQRIATHYTWSQLAATVEDAYR